MAAASGASGVGTGGSANECDAPLTGAAGDRGSAGAGGTATGAGGAVAAGTLYECPDPPPSNGAACANDSITCVYATKSCACYSNQWRCADCPACQPAATATCGDVPYRVSMSCRYGTSTCACNRRTGDDAWHCGACPPVEPLSGDQCGNVPTGRCRYGADTCTCNAGSWSCETAACPPNPAFTNLPSRGCTSRNAAYTCHYAEQDQDCICLPDEDAGLTSSCSCPTLAPVEGTPCIASVRGCTYGDVSCTCGGAWTCTRPPPDPCPTSEPIPGNACATRISICAYGGRTCSCDGASWSCS